MHDLDVVAEVAAGGGVAEGDLGAGGGGVQGEVVLDFDGDADVGMVAEVLADAGEFVDDGDAHSAQVVGGADAGEEEELGGGDGAGADDDVGAEDGEYFVAAFHFHADGFFALKEDAAAGDIGADGEG